MRKITEIGTIRKYHAHVYFNAGNREEAAQLRARVEERFEVCIGPWRDLPIGPHLTSQYQIAFSPDQFPAMASFLMMNRMGLTVLLHPETGRGLDDHTLNAVWMGEVLPVNTKFLLDSDAARYRAGS